MKRISIVICMVWVGLSAKAQSYLNFSGHPYAIVGTQMSETSLNGTARYVGTGGVMGSVGGDISNLSTNPAGLGMFSRSEFEITPSFQINNVNSNYTLFDPRYTSKVNWNQNQGVFALPSVGVVIANRKSETLPLRASNVTIGINRTANYNRNVAFGVDNNNFYSYSNYMAAQLTGSYTANPGAFPLGVGLTEQNYYQYPTRPLMAYEAELLSFNTTTNRFIDPVIGSVDQYGNKKISGGIDELSFAWAGNWVDKYYFGISMGVPFFKYQSELLYTESDRGSSNRVHPFYGKFNSYTVSEIDKYTGTGVNLKIGGLAKITKDLKASLYFHTPTYFALKNNYAVGMTTVFDKSTISKNRTLSEYEMSYVSPLKVGVGLSYMILKSGFIAAEYEFCNVQNTNINLKDDAKGTNYINSVFTQGRLNTHKIKLGGEFAHDIFRLRAGINYMTTPYTSAVVSDGGDLASMTYTVGLGVRGQSASFDLAFIKNQFKDYNTFYTDNANREIGISSWNSQNQIVATFNYRFR